jgi:hypothetical protein
MKKIEEEWKTIEEFPDYEISNFGRCRNKKNHCFLKVIRKKDENRVRYRYRLVYLKEEGVKRRETEKSPGILVAKAFVGNPNGYKCINYLDGDISNAMFSNIEWTKYFGSEDGIKDSGYKKKQIQREEQLKTIRKRIELAQRFEKSIIEGRENEFIYGELMDICKKIVYLKYRKKRNNELKEEIIHFVLDTIYDRVKRGYACISFENIINIETVKFNSQFKNQLKTVEFDERRM